MGNDEGARRLDRLYDAMIRWEAGCPHRIQHLIKVHSFAAHIARAEHVDPETQYTLEAAALVHDIGIRPALEKYGSDAGPFQEKEGMPAARAMLEELGFDEAVTDRVAYLVGHHHTYSDIDGIDYRILVEADFLVNDHEHPRTKEDIRENVRRVFRTAAGIRIAGEMFGLEAPCGGAPDEREVK